MYFPHAFKKSYLLPNGTLSLASGVTTSALTAGQIGMYAVTNNAATAPGNANSTLATLAASTTPFYIVGGSYFTSDKIGVHGGYKESWKSKLINPKYISRVIRVVAKSPVNHVIKVSSSAGVVTDSTYRLRLDIKGSPALRFLNHQLYRVLDAYSGCANVTNPTYVRDPLVVLLQWKDQINSYPLLNTMVQARVYKSAGADSAIASFASVTTTSANLTWASIPAYAAVGQKVTGANIPANSFITNITTNTATITYPTQAAAPGITGTPTISFWNDMYTDGSTGATYIPGTTVQADNAISSTASANGAITYSTATTGAVADNATITPNSHLELTIAYADTTFQNCTFTPTDKYDLEPLIAYASVVDESGNPCQSAYFTANSGSTSPYLSSHGFEVQAPVQASGVGESVLRDLILSGRYLQNAYPDSSRVEQLRMREIEADPMLSSVTRSALYDQILILHNVPRWNNPSGMFDNDQYLLQFFVPTGSNVTALTTYITGAANLAQGGTSVTLEHY